MNDASPSLGAHVIRAVTAMMWWLCATSAFASPPTELGPLLASYDQDERHDLKAIVIVINGSTAAERYYNGATADTLHDVRSAGKSITSLLVGIAVDNGLVKSLDDPVSRYLPRASDRPVGAVALKHLLTMRSGLDSNDEQADSPGNERWLDAASDPVEFALALNLRDPPGTRYVYNSVTAYVVGLTLERAVGERLDSFAERMLFHPLGIKEWRWRLDRAGHTTAQGNLSLTARDFAKLGQLVLDGGLWQRHRVISERWIEDSLVPRAQINAVDRYADGYGYFWYSKTYRLGPSKTRVSFASGNGGNKIYIVPDRSLVVAIQSSAYGQGYGQRRSEEILLRILEIVKVGRVQ